MSENWVAEADRFVEHGLWLQEMDWRARNIAVALFGVACLDAAERGAIWVSLREAGLWRKNASKRKAVGR